MTSDMSFECLLVSGDDLVVGLLSSVLERLSICTNVCPNLSTALEQLTSFEPELVIVDREDASLEFLKRMQKPRGRTKPTIVVISPNDDRRSVADVVLCRPITRESGTKAINAAYSQMLHRYRRHTRYSLMSMVRVTDELNHSADVTITNIGDGGLGLSSAGTEFVVGDQLSFRLLLPGAVKPVQIQARVQWTRTFGILGCEFLHIPTADLHILRDWLTEREQVKKPMIET